MHLRVRVHPQGIAIARAKCSDTLQIMRKKNVTTWIFLGGGGSFEKSAEFEREFVKCADAAKAMIYIPNAMKPSRHESCLLWFKSVMGPLGVAHIAMWNELKPKVPVQEIGGIYMGGGDTGRLLFQLRESGFSRYLKSAFAHGVPIYGGSAGAIVLGTDIRTTPEAADFDGRRARGLALLPKHSVCCHYDGDEEKLMQMSKRLEKPVLGIPETAGVVVESHRLRVVGDPVVLAAGARLKALMPGDSTDFLGDGHGS